MTTYANVKKQIAQLEKRAVELRKTEVAKVVASIRAQMAAYDLSVEDIAPAKSSAQRKVPAGTAKAKAPNPARYMDPKSGKTWTGHGKSPAWIAVATKKGRRDDFLIEQGQLTKGTKPVAKAVSTVSATPSKRAAAKKIAVKAKKLVAKKVPPAKKTHTSPVAKPKLKSEATAKPKRTVTSKTTVPVIAPAVTAPDAS